MLRGELEPLQPPLAAPLNIQLSACSFFILKIVQTVKVIITQTNHITYRAKIGYFNLNQNPTAQVHYKESSLMHSFLLLYSGNANKTTHDVNKLFTWQGEQPCSCSLAPLFFFFSLFIYLTSVALEQPAVMLEQTGKNRSAVLTDLHSCGADPIKLIVT